jgi:hypothetical protein
MAMDNDCHKGSEEGRCDLGWNALVAIKSSRRCPLSLESLEKGSNLSYAEGGFEDTLREQALSSSP